MARPRTALLAEAADELIKEAMSRPGRSKSGGRAQGISLRSPDFHFSPIPRCAVLGRARALAVADLHLEKGSSFAARGQLLPPYDTATTLARLSHLIADYTPRCVVALGDSFHDGGGPARLGESDRENLRIMQRGREWIWIAGNHDPEPAEGIGGNFTIIYRGAFDFPSLAERCVRGSQRPFAPGRTNFPSGTRGQPPLLCCRQDADGDAGFRRIHRRP